MMFHKNPSAELNKDLAKLLKEEGRFVKELSDVATKAAEFHVRLESIEKALESDPSAYHSNEADQLVNQAKEKIFLWTGRPNERCHQGSCKNLLISIILTLIK